LGYVDQGKEFNVRYKKMIKENFDKESIYYIALTIDVLA